MPSRAASPYFATASARLRASISKLTGSAPTLVMICASPAYTVGRDGSGAPSVMIGTMRRIVPTLRSVTISSR